MAKSNYRKYRIWFVSIYVTIGILIVVLVNTLGYSEWLDRFAKLYVGFVPFGVIIGYTLGKLERNKKD